MPCLWMLSLVIDMLSISLNKTVPMAKGNIAVTQLLAQWIYHSLVLSHWCYGGGGDDDFEEIGKWERIQAFIKLQCLIQLNTENALLAVF